MNKSIVHMDLDTFFVSCERLIDSRLNNRPVLIGGTSDRGVVASCSYEARKFGIHSSMPMRMAKQLCPEAVILRGNSGIYSKYSKLVTEIIKSEVPVYEKTSVDEFYLDLTGMDRIFGCHKFTSELRTKIIRESGLPISFGLSINKTVSKIATGEAKPNNEINVLLGTEKSFLAPLSVKKIPMIGAKTYRTLCDLGVKKIHSIQDMPVELMANVFGKNGIVMWKKANGIDDSPVIPYREKKSISTELTFSKDTIDTSKLESIITAMAENLTYQLRKKNKLTSCITVKIRYSDFQTYTLQKIIPYSAADHNIIPMVLELYNKLYKRRVLVRLVGVRFSHLVEGSHQINLFEDTNILNLYKAMDTIRNRYGDRAVMRASGMEMKKIGS
jgi:DNA polymerase-4